MQIIYKYPLTITDEQQLTLPRGAQMLSVQLQHDAPQLWVLLDPDVAEQVTQSIVIVGTGNPCRLEGYQYLSTFQVDWGTFVWHVFTKEVPTSGVA